MQTEPAFPTIKKKQHRIMQFVTNMHYNRTFLSLFHPYCSFAAIFENAFFIRKESNFFLFGLCFTLVYFVSFSVRGLFYFERGNSESCTINGSAACVRPYVGRFFSIYSCHSVSSMYKTLPILKTTPKMRAKNVYDFLLTLHF